jgi:hypothetical protein
VGAPKICDTPPANTCKNATTVMTYPKTGTCTAASGTGQCNYPLTESLCDRGCETATGACKGDPCSGIVCAAPPSPCYKTPGTCADGKCTYAPDEGKLCDDKDSCTESDKCSLGKCQGAPKLCNTPPATTCKDASTLKVYTAPGTCSGGTCTFASADVACPLGCDAAAGKCKGDPCATVKCETPPNGKCYTVPGSCSSGKCTYLPKSGAACDDGNLCTHGDKCDSGGTCAGTAYTCKDSLVCTTDTCDGQGGCTFPLETNACRISGDCYQAGATKPAASCGPGPCPGDTCEYCDPAKSQSLWSVSGGTQSLIWTFDGSVEGFTFQPDPPTPAVKWQVDTKRADSPTRSLYFGNVATHTYDDPWSSVLGDAISPEVTLPTNAGKLCLEFRAFLATEKVAWADQLSVFAMPGDVLLWMSGTEPNNANTGGFRSYSLDVTAFAGQKVQFRFNFDSIDDINNSTEGVYLDNIRLLSNCTP